MYEKFRPRIEELVGIEEEKLRQLEECIKSRKSVLIFGPPGTGKTSSVYAIAEKLGYKVLEYNASDERKKENPEVIRDKVKTRTLEPVVFLLDEIDGLRQWRLLGKIISESRHPIVMTANERWRIPESIQERCVKIEYGLIRARDVGKKVKEMMEKLNVKSINPSRVTGDLRSMLIASFYGGETYEALTPFKIVERVFENKPVDLDCMPFDDLMIWLQGNVQRFYSHRRLFEAINILCLADYLKKPEILRLLPKGEKAKAVYPYFLKRIKVMEES